MTAADQLSLFPEAASDAPMLVPKTTMRGPHGLLMALVEIGLREDAYDAAAALVSELDAEPVEGRE